MNMENTGLMKLYKHISVVAGYNPQSNTCVLNTFFFLKNEKVVIHRHEEGIVYTFHEQHDGKQP